MTCPKARLGWPPAVARTAAPVLVGDYLPINVMDGPLSNCKSKAKQFVLVCKSALPCQVAPWRDRVGLS